MFIYDYLLRVHRAIKSRARFPDIKAQEFTFPRQLRVIFTYGYPSGIKT